MTEQNPLTLYNSLTRKKEPFIPQDPKRVTMYNCGPTVYSYAHIGNARAAVVADVLFRVLRHIYGEDHVVYARNITDVDDRIIQSAKETGKPISEITEKYARIYNEDLTALNCLPPTHQPKVSMCRLMRLTANSPAIRSTHYAVVTAWAKAKSRGRKMRQTSCCGNRNWTASAGTPPLDAAARAGTSNVPPWPKRP